MTLGSLSVLDQETTILQISQLQKQTFWDNNFLNKRKFVYMANISVYLHYLLWAFTLLTLIAVYVTPYFPQTIYNDNWSLPTKFFVKTSAYLFFTYGYYIGIGHENYYAYTILHGYLQMNTLKAYLRHELHRYEKIDLTEKISSYKYQSLIEGAFLRCIKQHKKIVT